MQAECKETVYGFRSRVDVLLSEKGSGKGRAEGKKEDRQVVRQAVR